MEKKMYSLPELQYPYGALAPFISEDLLKLHHDKHHAAYVNGANAILKKLDMVASEGMEIDTKAALKELSFNIGGHVLHTLFWENMAPAGKGGGGAPSGAIASMINDQFGSFETFRKLFSQAAVSAEGSGWAALTFCKLTGRLMVMQAEKHNVNIYPMFGIVMVLDVWEHAYYLDYKSDRAKFVEGFWNVVNWEQVNQRLEHFRK